jgi:hypothetical protein
MKKYIIILIFFTLLASCGKDCTDSSNPECPNYNPCLALKPYSADFYCAGMIPWNQNFDTVPLEYRIQEGYVLGDFNSKFVSTQAGVKHIWKLGTETYQDSVFAIGFREEDVNHQFEVMHIIEYPISEQYKKCYPNATGRDTMIKKFTIESGKLTNMPLWGKYKGYVDAFPNREVTIEIVREYDNPDINNQINLDGTQIPLILIKNLDGQNKVNYTHGRIYYGLKNLYPIDRYPTIYLGKNGAIHIELFQGLDWNNNGNYLDDPEQFYFKGVRVN